MHNLSYNLTEMYNTMLKFCQPLPVIVKNFGK